MPATDGARLIDRLALAGGGSPGAIRHVGEGAARLAVSSPASGTLGLRPMNFLWAVLFLSIGAFLLWLAFADPGSAQELIDRYAWW